jgi:hypothetical protein
MRYDSAKTTPGFPMNLFKEQNRPTFFPAPQFIGKPGVVFAELYLINHVTKFEKMFLKNSPRDRQHNHQISA